MSIGGPHEVLPSHAGVRTPATHDLVVVVAEDAPVRSTKAGVRTPATLIANDWTGVVVVNAQRRPGFEPRRHVSCRRRGRRAIGAVGRQNLIRAVRC